jgi:hypothetical protein
MIALHIGVSLAAQAINETSGYLHTSALYGGYNLGYYYVNVYLGTPPTKQTLIVDTGSSITTLPCSDCTDCG